MPAGTPQCRDMGQAHGLQTHVLPVEGDRSDLHQVSRQVIMRRLNASLPDMSSDKGRDAGTFFRMSSSGPEPFTCPVNQARTLEM
jgi:hypothetical protein